MLFLKVKNEQELVLSKPIKISAKTTDLVLMLEDSAEFSDSLIAFFRIEAEGEPTYASVMTNKQCVVPWEVLEEKNVNGLLSVLDHILIISIADTGRTTTTELRLPVYKTAFVENPENSKEPTEDVYNQFFSTVPSQAELKTGNLIFKNSKGVTLFQADISELTNDIYSIRTGYDGTVYKTAGEAVRGQIGTITRKMVLRTSPNIYREKMFVNGYCSLYGGIGESSYYKYTSELIPVNVGDVLRSYRINDGALQLRIFGFVTLYDKNEQVLSALGQREISEYTVPEGGAFVRLTVDGQTVEITINYEATEYEEYIEPYYVATDEFIPQLGEQSQKIDILEDRLCEQSQKIDSLEDRIPQNVIYHEDDYNEIVNAKEVATIEELLSSTENAILYGYTLGYSTIEEDANNAVLKVFVNEGDVVRTKLASYWLKLTGGEQKYYYGKYDSNGNLIDGKSSLIYFGGHASENYLDYRNNGIVVPSGVEFMLINIMSSYRYNSDGSIATNGKTADIITVNQDAALTDYANFGEIAEDYVAVDGGYYECTDDYRIARYEGILGDIETVLATVVGGE